MGECCHCGECCKWIVFGQAKMLDPWALSYFKARGMKIDKQLVLIPSVCPQLFEEIEGVFKCKIEDKKPAACKLYNGSRITGGRAFWIPDSCTMPNKVKKRGK